MIRYNPVFLGGIVHILDPSQGYHRTNIYLATRFPRVANKNQNPLSIFAIAIWLAIAIANTLIVILVFNAIMIYKKVNIALVRSDLDTWQIMVRLWAGFTEPDDEVWFRKFSTGKFLMLLWSISAFFLMAIFNVDLRAKLIAPEIEKPIDTIQDIDFARQKILLEYDEGTKLTSLDQSQFKNLVPKYVELNTKMITPILTGQDSYINANGLTNIQIYDFIEKDINVDDAILVSSNYRYNEYVDWLINNKPMENLNLRLSRKRLHTKSNREQFIVLMRKYHPWLEEINYCILQLEESGILTSWGDKELRVDTSRNPNIKEATQNNKYSINTLSPLLTYLGIGLAVGVLALAIELVVKRSSDKTIKFNQKFKYKNGLTNVILVTLLGILSWKYFEEEPEFPAVICE